MITFGLHIDLLCTSSHGAEQWTKWINRDTGTAVYLHLDFHRIILINL